MINNISWASYLYALIILLIIYYSAILWLYYRNEVLKLFQSQGKRLTEKGVWTPPHGEVDQITQSLADELNAFFEESKRLRCERQELIYGLQRLLRKHPAAQSSFKEINELIIVQSKKICSIHLYEDEVSKVWFG